MADKKIKKIVLFNQTFGLGGAETFLTDLLVELKKQGLEIEVYTNYLRWQKILDEQGINVRHVPFDLDIIGDWKGLIKAALVSPYAVYFYWQVIKQSSADYYLFPTFGDKILGTVIAKFLKRKVVWIEFGPLASVLKKFFYIPKLLYLMVKDYPQLVITSSQHSRKKLITEVEFKPQQIFVIPCGRNVPSVQKLKNYQKNKRIVCISRLEPGKGQDLLITAMAKIHDRFSSVKLKIVGEGDWLVQLMQLRDKMNLKKQVEFTGRVGDAWQEINQADVVICPSMWELEGFGMVAIEAMALAKPVVGFNRGPTNEIVNRKIGLLANPGDANDLADKIGQLLENSTLAKKLGKAGGELFIQKYTIFQVAQQYILALKKYA